MANPPVIPNLPPAPTRSDGPEDFTPKADAMMGALQPMVTAENALGAWMNSTASQVAADALFAGQAADRAEAVDTNVSEQVEEAAAYAASAKASATAAESAQGSLGNLALMYAIALAS